MSPTVHALRNQIRLAVDRYERVETTQFTKESLHAIALALDTGLDPNTIPSKDRMRGEIRHALGLADTANPDERGSALTKDELQTLADHLENE